MEYKTENEAIEHLKAGVDFCAYMFDLFRNNRNVVIVAVKEDGLALEEVSEELKDDKEVVIEAVQENGLALEFASKRRQGNKKVVLAAVKENPLALEFASKKLRSDKEVVLAAVKQNEKLLLDACLDLVRKVFDISEDDPVKALTILIERESLESKSSSIPTKANSFGL